jgi:glycosyltransferase involved in cell wall biosynthesis
LLALTLNELEGVKKVLPRVKPEWVDQLIVVDGGSNDGTLEYVRQHGYDVLLQKRKGLRWAYLEALPHIRGDVVITFSPDGNSVPEVIPALVAKISQGYDMVVVSRYMPGAKSYDDSFLTASANLIITRMTNLLYRGHYTDSMVIYRAFKKDLVSLLDLDNEDTYRIEERLIGRPVGWELVMSIRCAKQRLKTDEIPGDELPRTDGTKRVHYGWGIAMVIEVIAEVFRWR